MKCAGALIILLYWIKVSVDAAEWNYGNVSEWGGLCVTGIQQSPIDLIADDTAVEKVFTAFQFANYDIAYPAKIKNNGHTVTITLNATAAPTITEGGLLDTYVLDHFHFHWQSEHTVNGHRFPLEMHLVHYSTRYTDVTQASAHPGGVAVLGVLFELSIDDDEDFIPLIEVMQNVLQHPDEEVELNRNIAARSFLPRNTGDYYRYTGSLTTPACNEGVIWTVFHKTLPLSANQVLHFESVWSKEGPLTLNYRPIQALNGRTLNIRNIPRAAAPSISISIVSIIVFCTLPVIKTHLM